MDNEISFFFLKSSQHAKKNNWILKSLFCEKKQNFHSAVLFGLTKMSFQSSSLTEHLIGFYSHRKHTSQLRCTAVFGLCRTVLWCLETFFRQCGPN